MSRAKRIEEAARELRDTIDRIFDNPKTTASMPGAMREKMRYLDAALAAPEDEGDVVQRAANVLHGEHASGMTDCFKYAHALASAGLLAGKSGGPCELCKEALISVREIGGER